MDDDFTLILDPVTAADSRGYQCIATNDVGQTAINVTLNVERESVCVCACLSS